MRATRSDNTVLENVFIPDRYVARAVPAGGAGIDSFILSIFAWALMGFGNIYYGLSQTRARREHRGCKKQELAGGLALDGVPPRSSACYR